MLDAFLTAQHPRKRQLTADHRNIALGTLVISIAKVGSFFVMILKNWVPSVRLTQIKVVKNLDNFK